MDPDRSKLSDKLKHWLTAMAKVFYNGDEEAAWADVLKTAKEDEKRWGPVYSEKPRTARLHLRATKSKNQ